MQGKPYMYRIKSRLPADADTAFEWHKRPGAMERLLPPWEEIKILSREGGIKDGDKISLKMSWGPFEFNWDLKHQDYMEGRQFCDVQENGPFRYWIHRHIFRPIEDSEYSTLKDAIDYRLPMGMIGRFLGKNSMTKKLNRVFGYRHEITKKDLKLYGKYRFAKSLRILIAGSGMIGEALRPFFTTQGHQVYTLSRKKKTQDAILWNPAKGEVKAQDVENFDVVINLCGERIDQKWGRAAKKRIINSRVDSTKLLAETLAQLENKPLLMINASGVGYYGAVDGKVTEESPKGDGFLADVCKEWEAATKPASEAGIRVVHLRMGAVLSPRGGALPKLLKIYRKGLGGKLGSGRQPFSWISIEDVLGAIYHCIHTHSISGPVNLVSPVQISNAEFNVILSEKLRKMGWFKTPSFVIKLVYGKMGKELLLQGSQVFPQKLTDTGYEFEYANLDKFLNLILEK